LVLSGHPSEARGESPFAFREGRIYIQGGRDGLEINHRTTPKGLR
jgi:hypothetical protein